MHGDILEFVNDMIDRSGKSLRQIAEEIGKPYGTLKRELNEFDDGAKFGAMTLLPVARCCPGGLCELTQYFAARSGQRLVDMTEACPDKPTLPEEMLDDLPHLAALHEAVRQGKPLEAVHELLQAAIRDLEQDFVAYRAELTKRPAKGKREAA